MSIYDHIIKGLDSKRTASGSLSAFLESLKPVVKMLRAAYWKRPVYVPYHKENVQSAYLITYLPHYYQLIEKVLREQNPDNLANKKKVDIAFIGGGPGSEVYGAIKHILSHNENIETINVFILDINATTWNYSHEIVQEYLIGSLPNAANININWSSLDMDIVDIETVNKRLSVISNSDLVVVQNCINEIASNHYATLSETIELIFDALPSKGALLMIDLTSSVRSQINLIEAKIKVHPDVQEIFGTTDQRSATQVVSINARPSEVIRKYLLDGTNGLIPRRNLKYDYSYISKCTLRESIAIDDVGLNALYEPLKDLNVDEVKTRTFVGLDFGTSVSVCTVAYVEDNELKLKTIPFTQKGPNDRKDRSPLLPSVIGVHTNQYMVGRHANDLKGQLTYGKNAWYDFKDHLGELEDIKYEKSILSKNDKVQISNAKEGLVALLKYINHEVEHFVHDNNLPSDIYYSVSIPASFPEYKKADLRNCLTDAGVEYNDTSFAFEPVSALIYSLYNEDITLDNTINEQNIMILDVGAGTLDVSILTIHHDGKEIEAKIRAVERTGEQGGNKLDKMICEYLKLSSELLHFVEKLKIKMCKSIPMDNSHTLTPNATSNNISQVKTGTNGHISLSFNELNEIYLGYWKLVLDSINKALRNAGLICNTITDIVLSGGGARNPYLRASIRSHFSNARMAFPDNIQEQVARGNALQSFVQNTFGKTLINTCIPDDIWIKSKKEKHIMFKKGTSTPSLEKEFGIDDLNDNKLILVRDYLSEELVFVIPEKFEKGFIFLTPDHNITCEVLANEETVILEPQYVKIEK